MSDNPYLVACDCYGRDLSRMAKLHSLNIVSPSFMGGDQAVIAKLLASGMSSIDANFIADYGPVNKTTLIELIDGGRSGYEALTVMYGAPYMPNLDPVTLPSYRHPSYAPPMGSASADTTVEPVTVTASNNPLDKRYAGIPLMYWLVGGGAAALLLFNN